MKSLAVFFILQEKDVVGMHTDHLKVRRAGRGTSKFRREISFGRHSEDYCFCLGNLVEYGFIDQPSFFWAGGEGVIFVSLTVDIRLFGA